MKKGYITLMIVIIVMTVTLGISLTLFNISFESIYRNYSNNTNIIIQNSAVNCREDILALIFDDTTYTATDEILDNCTYSVIDVSPTEKRLEIKIDQNEYVQRFEGNVSIGSVIEVTSWNKLVDFSTPAPPPINIVDSGLIMNLDAGDIASYPSTGTTWTNLINPFNNNGTLINGVGYSALNQGSLTFDGINDRGTFTSPITASSPQTYEVWVKAVPAPTASIGFGYVLHNNSFNNYVGSAFMGIGYSGPGYMGIYNREIFAFFNGAWQSMGTGVIADSTTIRQIVVTWDGANQTAYVDGAQRVTQPLTVIPANFSTTTSFGDFRDSTFRQIQGDIYSIKVYNRALSSSEVQQNFDALRGRYGL